MRKPWALGRQQQQAEAGSRAVVVKKASLKFS